MGLVKVEYLGSRIYRLYTQNLIQWAFKRFSVSFCRSQVVFLVFLLYISIYAHSSTMAERPETEHLGAVLQGNGLFTRNLYHILAKQKNKNIFFSPISIHAILSLAAQGSEGKTKKAFTDSLYVNDVNTLAKGYQEAMTQLNNVQDVTLLIANKIFIKESYELQEAFKDVVTNRFFSEVQNINFEKNTEAAKTINTWVEEKTKDKIKDLIQSSDLDKDTRLVLVNAIYFKGKWAEPFNPELTRTEKFFINEKDSIDVEMMHIKKKYYFKDDEALDAKLLELPYTNKDLSMIIILPNNRTGIDALEAKLANTDLTKITDNMHRPEVIVSLPKFKIEATINLEEPLTQLGLGEIFSANADFSKMLQSPESLQVSKVIQKAFIEVNEEGAEAAAATGITIQFRSLAISRPKLEFIADHPFFITLVSKVRNQEEKVTLNILFIGKILQPVYSSDGKQYQK